MLEAVGDCTAYIPKEMVRDGEGNLQPRVKTDFFVDHSELSTLRRKAARGDRPWSLGEISPGEEWCACTFKAQKPESIDSDRLERLLEGSDEIWIQAYEGMTLDLDHRWHAHTKPEVDFIEAQVNLRPPRRVLDVGCGDGRHCIEFASRGYEVIGIDISERLINGAASRTGAGPKIRFEVCDARKQLPEGPFDLVVCLYDVLGSSASRADDLEVLRNIRGILAGNGVLVLSVMNDEVVSSELSDDRRPHSLSEFVCTLEDLSPSATMETTGSIFDPTLLLFFDDVYYRKEQFSAAKWRLPTELVVRDRRFTVSRLEQDLGAAGLQLHSLRPVQAGAWAREPPLRSADPRAKELLAIAMPTRLE